MLFSSRNHCNRALSAALCTCRSSASEIIAAPPSFVYAQPLQKSPQPWQFWATCSSWSQVSSMALLDDPAAGNTLSNRFMDSCCSTYLMTHNRMYYSQSPSRSSVSHIFIYSSSPTVVETNWTDFPHTQKHTLNTSTISTQNTIPFVLLAFNLK